MNEPSRGSLDRLLGARATARPAGAPGTAEPEDQEQHRRFYGFLRGIRDRSFNIEFRPTTGPWLLIEYSYLVSAEWCHAGEFKLTFGSGHHVTVKGRHLREMYEQLRRHRVTYLRAAENAETAPDRELFIDEIIVPRPDVAV